MNKVNNNQENNGGKTSVKKNFNVGIGVALTAELRKKDRSFVRERDGQLKRM